MRSEIVVTTIDNIDAIATAHGIGLKKVFTTSHQCESKITQVAFGELRMNEKVENHKHPTMEEFYYFIEGQATFTINDQDFFCSSGTFVQIPAGIMHSLKVLTEIRFIYWGVAI